MTRTEARDRFDQDVEDWTHALIASGMTPEDALALVLARLLPLLTPAERAMVAD